MADYKKLKDYFEIAYRTGSDIWTHLPLKEKELMLTENLPKGSLILDLGSGRGLFAKFLAESGYSVIGLDFEKNIVERSNKEIKGWGLEGKLKFVEGDVFDIPFTDSSFDAVCDFSLMENLYKEDWNQYKEEVVRVLKPGGFYLNVSLSRDTSNFLEFNPRAKNQADVEKYGISYHFFDKDEMKSIFDKQLSLVEQKIKEVENPHKVVFLESLFQKK